jgi:hypothetical protein
MSYNRSIDKLIYDGIDEVVMGGENGTVPIPRPTVNDIAVDGAYDANGIWIPNSGTNTGLTIDKLRKAKLSLDLEYAYELGEYYLICSPNQIDNLLGTVEVTSADYSSIKALVNGEVDSFMGFRFVKYNDVRTEANVQDCYAIARGSLYLANQKQTGALRVTRAIRADKNDAIQILMKYDKGCSRFYDEGILKIECAIG